MENWFEMAPNGVVRIFPTNPDLADILGDTDFYFENFCFLDFLDAKFPDFQVPDFQKSGLGQAWAGLGPGLRRAWAKSLGEPVLHDGGTALSANPNRYPFFIVRTRQASLVGVGGL